MRDKIGIYIHIPFCESKCFYCDFCSSSSSNESTVQAYIESLIEEILSQSEMLSEYNIDTIYIGGGTPSFIDAKYIKDVMQVLFASSSVLEDAEITIEVNPESCTLEKLKTYKEIGINRISVGLQTIHDNILQNIGRKAKFNDFKIAYDNILKAGFENISVDLMCGLPGDNKQTFNETIQYILSLDKLKHISVYSLEVHENTKLDFLIENGFVSLPSEDEERDMKHALDESLEQNGFYLYEISNYAKQGFESKHNLKYWNSNYYIGFGCAAASYINSTRYCNTKSIEEYIQNGSKCNKSEIEQLDLLDLEKEFVILSLRLSKGIDKLEFSNRFKIDIWDMFKEELNKCIKDGLLEENKTNIYLTKRGQDLANIVWQQFI
ncbi:MAG: radical SAM family heme chaperone HemW [Clostridia bacterium]|nr:radical SAM family heme chaperone HemW [Clostridia bacterium]